MVIIWARGNKPGAPRRADLTFYVTLCRSNIRGVPQFLRQESSVRDERAGAQVQISSPRLTFLQHFPSSHLPFSLTTMCSVLKLLSICSLFDETFTNFTQSENSIYCYSCCKKCVQSGSKNLFIVGRYEMFQKSSWPTS